MLEALTLPPSEAARERAALGAALLDEEYGAHWVDEISQPVRTASTALCPLGQVFGEYVLGLARLKGASGSWSSRHGFNSRPGMVLADPTYQDLDRAWAAEIESRKALRRARPITSVVEDGQARRAALALLLSA